MINGIVSAVPKNRVEITNAKFKAATGVAEHRVVTGDQNTLSLAVAASERLLEAVEWSPSDLSAIIFVTQTPPTRMPATACALGGAIGAKCAAFDVNLACSGYVYGLVLASIFGGRHTLLVAGDCVSKMVKPGDLANEQLFGDCVTATAVHEGRFINVQLGTDGSGFGSLIADPFIRMDGPAVMEFALREVPGLVQRTSMNGYTDWNFFHQANSMILKSIIRKCKLDAKKTPINIQKWGNTSSASIPLLMCNSEATESLKTKANRIAAYGFGSGWSFGGCLLDIPPLKIAEVLEVE